ncbi:MAG: type IV pili methyl-accepting chemotaxis transducer N-terminal domain-containing protein [Cyclobacteriaceae bacterium]
MPKPKFRRLGLFYLIALGCIALSIVVSQLLIQTSIGDQQDDAHVINVAGRQRMLSQKITKSSLRVVYDRDSQDKTVAVLRQDLDLWRKSHEGLQNGSEELQLSGSNSAEIKKMFLELEPHFNAIYSNAEALISLKPNGSVQAFTDNNSHLESILIHESDFLKIMDRIVFQYDFEAQDKVQSLKQTELYLFVISLIIILMELIFIFRPIAKSVSNTVDDLVRSENEAKKMTTQLSHLYEELGKSYQDLEAVNIKPESPSLYARMNRKGKFKFLSSQFHKMMDYEETKPPKSLQELLTASGYRDDFATGLLDMLRDNKNWTGEIRLITEPGDFCWIDAYLVPIKSTNEIKLIASETTEYKEAKIRSRELNKERIEKSVKEQHYRSSLILEGQEEERKRLSRELHDGVGQMLSAMKLMLESFNPSSKPMKMRLNDAKDLMKSIIQEVRRVSFNLTPSSLDDFGLVPAIKKFCDEINAVTKTNVAFVNETKFINRLESPVETNLYRIIQESVNNSIKYSKASNIEVRFSHTVNSLSIKVKDDGKGFDYSRLVENGHFEKAGHGIFNMKERTAYIGGIFNLETELGKGTQIFITLSLDKND